MKSLSCSAAAAIAELVCIIVLFMPLAPVSSKNLARGGITHVVIEVSGNVSKGSSSCAADCAFECVARKPVAMDNASSVICSSLGEALLKASQDIFQCS